MIKENERIESLRRAIKLKKDNLGLNGDMLYLKALKKYNNLNELKYPKSVDKYQLYEITEKQDRFQDISYRSVYETNKLKYVFSKLVDTISKKVSSDFIELSKDKSLNEIIENINQYIKDKTLYLDYSISKSDDKLTCEYAEYLVKKYSKANSKCMFIVNSRYKFVSDVYTAIDVVISSRTLGSWSGVGMNEGKNATIVDLSKIVAKGILVKEVSEYLSKEDNSEKIKEKISKVIVFNKDYDFKTLSSGLVMNELIEDNGGGVLNAIQILISLSMEEMLKKSFEIYQYEERLKSLSGDYAKTYMTKKNIPKKIEEFMKNNIFLNMFGFVEADADCELDKLNKLSEEFKQLSEKMFLPVSKNQSLRFRKLGKLKAMGVYYPGYDTLAVDLDGVSSFIHEMFHMMDFENDILSLNDNFEPLLERYRNLMDGYVNELGEGNEIYEFWYKGKSKYSRAYYSSNEEAFARMGELYVTDILNINSSFAKVDYSKPIQKVVYPKSEELLNLIKEYYDNLFIMLEEKFDRVSFEEVTTPSENVKKTLEQGFVENNISSEQINIFTESKIKNKDININHMSSFFSDEPISESNQMSFF